MAKKNEKKIMVAINDTPASMAALELGIQLAKWNKARLFLAYVFEVPRSLPLEVHLPQELQKGDRLLEKGLELADEADVEVETHFIQARSAGPGIVDEAKDLKIDFLIIGINTPLRIAEFIFGSTVKYVLSKADCQVLVVKPKQEK